MKSNRMLVMIVLIATFFLASCVDDPSSNANLRADLDDLQSQIDRHNQDLYGVATSGSPGLFERVGKLEEDAIPTPVCTVPPTGALCPEPSAKHGSGSKGSSSGSKSNPSSGGICDSSDCKPSTTLPKQMDGYQERQLMLTKMDTQACLQVADAYSFISPPKPRFDADGAEFYFNCADDSSGWGYRGTSADVWKPASIDFAKLGGRTSDKLSIEELAPPNAHHPHFVGALTLDQIKPGVVACYFTAPYKAYTVEVANVYTQVSIGTYGTSVFPAFDLINVRPYLGDDHENETWTQQSLIVAGVVPDITGFWSKNYLVAGVCGS